MAFAERLAQIKFGRFRYNSPWTQVALLGFIVFCTAGMFSALSGLGAGGTDDTTLADTANSVLYGMFAITGFFAGSINNILGPRLTLSIGSIGYGLYSGSLWAYQVHGTKWFYILAGAILGVTAALLWSAQGALMMAYPEEKDKGRAFALFWSIFQLGTLIGSSIALGIQSHSSLGGVSTAVYVVFMIIMLTAIGTSWFILPPSLVVRGDGTVVETQDALPIKEEFRSFAMQFKDWRMLALLPMFFSSNYFYSYQGAITAYLFTPRTRALSALLTGLGSILGSIFIGIFTDILPFGRRKRALLGCGVVLLLNIIVWSGGIAFQVQFKRSESGKRSPLLDYGTGGSAGPLILLLSYYIADAAYQGLAYYTMSAMSNDPFKLARMAGYYKGLQSAGSAISFAMDAVKTAYLTELLVSWILLLVSLPLCFAVLWYCKDSNYATEHTVHVGDAAAGDLHAAVPSNALHYGLDHTPSQMSDKNEASVAVKDV